MSLEKSVKPAITRFFQNLVRPHNSIQDSNLKQKAEISSAIAIFIAVLSFFASILVFSQRNNFITYIALGFLCLFGISVIAYILSRSRQPNLAALLLTISLSVTGYILTIASGQSVNTALYFTIPLSMLVGSILLPGWAAVIIVAMNIVATLFVPLAVPSFPRLNAYLLAINFTILGASTLAVMVARNLLEHRRVGEVLDINLQLKALQTELEHRVDERTRQVRIAAEIAQGITATLDLDDLLRKTVDLIIERFEYYQASIFLIDETGRFAVLCATQGPSAAKIMERTYRLAVGSPSIIGWVTSNKLPRLASNVAEDPIHLKNEFLPETQTEAAVPIISGDEILGALDIQSVNVNAFDNETILTLQTLSNQIAAAIKNARSHEIGEFNLQEVNDFYRTGIQIRHSATEDEIYKNIQVLLSHLPFFCFYFSSEEEGFYLKIKSSTISMNEPIGGGLIKISKDDLDGIFSRGSFIGEQDNFKDLPQSLSRFAKQLQFFSLALVPVRCEDEITAFFMIGIQEKKPLAMVNIQPFINIADLVSATLDQIHRARRSERQIIEAEAITLASQEISTLHELPAIYSTLHNRIREALRDVDFLIALYDTSTNSISIPYMYETSAEGGKIQQIEPFPLGEGLTSILIRTKQPLMIVEDTEKRATALGAKVIGQAAKSWLGVPILIAGEVIGAIIIQDTVEEHAFNDNDLRFLTSLATQVAGVIHNIRLLEETSGRALQLQTAAEIARDISGSLDLGELLHEAVSLVRERYRFYHASIFLIDEANEYAVIREATGEAGMQMKRTGHKLKIGSKSIVGYVTGSGEPLIVNDTSHDATYYANPLLSETRSEAAIPLKVGTRILGVLDVQSSQPYAFGKEVINVLRILADQLAIAVINSELFAETQEHLSQHRLLHHVTTAAASGTTLDESLNSATQGLQVTLGGDRVAILLADKDKKVLTIKAIAGYSEDVKKRTIPFGEGITGWVAVHQQVQRVNDTSQDNRYVEVGSNVRSELAVPLSYRGELLGVLNVESDRPGAYSENDEELLGTLGGSLAAIMANARLLEQIRRQVDNERLLYEVTSKIRRSTDMQTIMATTTSELSKALGARRAQIKINVSNDQDKDSHTQSGQ